jgi:hypothetical protein
MRARTPSSYTARLTGMIDLGVAMDIRTFAELTTPDERSLRFTPLGLATGGMLSPENAAEFQQRSIATADLVPVVPESTGKALSACKPCTHMGCSATTCSP